MVLGQRLIGIQTGAWLVFGVIYLGIGAAFLLGTDGRFRKRILIPPEIWRAATNPLVQGAAFGLNTPACAAPILFGLIGAATATGSASVGFILMDTFALALSLPLVPLSAAPRLAAPLDRLANWIRPRLWLMGLVFVALGLWSIWFGLSIRRTGAESETAPAFLACRSSRYCFSGRLGRSRQRHGDVGTGLSAPAARSPLAR